ncbi:Flp pilus assembly protein TadB [Lipingzhangella halophila]|uniref:Flp pilus assembly protein TadB n=1 Tax=Lipingzhangella halophila TaxID=1783352 RepID=A0A7W7RGA6_9ACTN|nr:hypothetical protein [Lipingzhangella halophila]MBB4931355.1 Flp pilus assembly protein TadB [Lipingzhangella halophila]
MHVLIAFLALVHASAGALWLGAMAYSLFVVRPRLAGMLDGDDETRMEEAQQLLASGNRWPTASLIVVLWLSGIGLVAAHGGGSYGWWAGVAVKALLLTTATALFWWVSWRGWPRRVFALPEELPALRRKFDAIAAAMLALVGATFALGVLL